MGPREHVPYQSQHQTGLKDAGVPTPTGDSLAPPPTADHRIFRESNFGSSVAAVSRPPSEPTARK